MGLTRARDLIIDSAPILAWRRADPDAAFGHAPTIPVRCCWAIGCTRCCVVAPGCRCCSASPQPTSTVPPSPTPPGGTGRAPVCPEAECSAPGCGLLGPQAGRLDSHRPRRGRRHPLEPQAAESAGWLPPTWTADELSKRTSVEHFFRRVLVFFRLQRPPVFGWSAVETRVALTYASVWVIALAAYQAGRPDLIRSPRLVLAHVWERVGT
jgi:hypothetical protein